MTTFKEIQNLEDFSLESCKKTIVDDMEGVKDTLYMYIDNINELIDKVGDINENSKIYDLQDILQVYKNILWVVSMDENEDVEEYEDLISDYD